MKPQKVVEIPQRKNIRMNFFMPSSICGYFLSAQAVAITMMMPYAASASMIPKQI